MATIGRPADTNPYSNIAMKNDFSLPSDIKYKDVNDHVQMGKEGFLQLLTNQLTHQDPANPMDSDKLGAELAQFSQLEQLNNINSSIDNGQKKTDLVNDRFYSATLLGKQVSSASTNFSFDGKSPVEIPVYLQDEVKNLIVRIYDLRGQMVGQLEKSDIVPGDHRFLWDGIGLDSQMVASGEYTFEVIAWDQTGMQVNVDGKATGVVTGVNFKDGEIILEIDGKQKVSLSDIEGFR